MIILLIVYSVIGIRRCPFNAFLIHMIQNISSIEETEHAFWIWKTTSQSISEADDRSHVTVARIARFLVHPVPERHIPRIPRSYARYAIRDTFLIRYVDPEKNEDAKL